MTNNPTNENSQTANTPNESSIDIADDTLLSAALLAEVPAHGAEYWASIDHRLATYSGDHALAGGDPVDTETAPADTSLDISTGSTNDASTPSTGLLLRLRTWPVIAAAAALVLIAGFLAVTLLPGDNEQVDVGFADEAPNQLNGLPGPTQDLDHWNAIYGVWDCTADGGNGDWVAPFQSTEDDVGIHSHGDGLISIHPFVDEAAGRNATFSQFADSMNFTVTAEAITLDDGRTLSSGTTCGGQPAVIEMYRWQDARALELDPTLPPRIIVTDNFGDQRFFNDLEVWTLALTPVGTEIPLPPRERFDELAAWWFPPESAARQALPTPSPQDQVGVRPAHDTFTTVWLAESGANADEALTQILGWVPPQSTSLDTLVPGSGARWIAVSPDTRTVAYLATYDVVGDNTVPQQWSCEAIALPDQELLKSSRCAGSRRDETRIDIDFNPPTHTSIALWHAEPAAEWFLIETETGARVLANVEDGLSYASWSSQHGLWTRVDVLDANHDILWSETCRLPTTMFCAREGQVISIPAHDAFVQVQLLAAGSEVDQVIEASLSGQPSGLPATGTLEPGSGTRWLAVAGDVRLQFELITYTKRDDAPGLAPTLSCSSVVNSGGSCTRSDSPLAYITHLRSDTMTPFESVALWNAPQDGVWLSIRTADGHRVLANVVEGTSWAAWRSDRGSWVTAEVLDADHNTLWSKGNG